MRCLRASGIHQSQCTRRTRNCCCPDPALAARTYEVHKKNSYSGISSTVTSTVRNIGISCTISSMKQLMFFLFLVTVVLFLVCSRCFFFLPSNPFARQNLRRTEGKYRWKSSIKCQNSYSESVHPTDSVMFRTCQLVVSSLFGQSQLYLRRFCRQIL